MSHIHDALKKAQKEKTAHSPEHIGVVAPGGISEPKPLRRKLVWLAVPVLFSCVVLALYLWGPWQDTRSPAPDAERPAMGAAGTGGNPEREDAPPTAWKDKARIGSKGEVSAGMDSRSAPNVMSTSPARVRNETTRATKEFPGAESSLPGRDSARPAPAAGREQTAAPPTAAPGFPAAPPAGVVYDRAWSLQKSGRLDEAMVLYERTLKEDPEHVDALNNVGVIHMHDKNYPAARSAFSEVIRLRPDYVDAYYNLSCVYAMEGRVPESLVHLKKALSLNPSVRVWAKNDTDLANLRGVPDFERVLKNREASQQP